MGGRAVALHRGAQQREPAEHRIERVERRGPGHDQDLGALTTQRLQLVGDGA